MYRSIWDGSIKQLSCAVRFAQATAVDYGGEAGPSTLVGFASGGAIGAVTALAGEDFGGECAATDAFALPKALLAFSGFFDYATMVYGEFDHTVLEDEDPELCKAINPYAHIGRNPDLLVRLIEVTDTAAARQRAVDFHQALVDAGYGVTLTRVEGATHNDIDKTESEAFQIRVQQTLEVAGSETR